MHGIRSLTSKVRHIQQADVSNRHIALVVSILCSSARSTCVRLRDLHLSWPRGLLLKPFSGELLFSSALQKDAISHSGVLAFGYVDASVL